MARSVQHVLIVSAATVGSRILGLLRDILLFAVLGTGALNSAFIFAFTIPNLFRRLLGEGALNSAVIPVFTRVLEAEDRGGLFALLNRITSRLALTLAGLVLLFCGLLLLLLNTLSLAPRWELGLSLTVLLLPYALLVCLAALQAAALNVLRFFTVAALSQVWLNLAMIAALGWGAVNYGLGSVTVVWVLCGAVLLGGFLQWFIPLLALRRQGWSGSLRQEDQNNAREVWRLLLPGVIGAAIFQINTMVSRMLALWVDESAVSILYLASRLIELPLGVFVISITTVLFPRLSSLAVKAQAQELRSLYTRGLRIILAITLAAAAGLIVLREPILEALFEWGAFGSQDVQVTSDVLALYALALPFYGMIGLATRAYHAQRDMQTPMRMAAWVFVINLGLSLLLMVPYGMYGLAMANVAAGMAHYVLLSLGLRKEGRLSLPMLPLRGLATILVAVAVMAGSAYGLEALLQQQGISSKTTAVLTVAVIVPFCAGLYMACLGLLRFEERQEMLRLILRKGR